MDQAPNTLPTRPRRPRGATGLFPRIWLFIPFAIALGLCVAVLRSQVKLFNWEIWLRPGMGRPWSGGWQFPVESLRALGAGAAVLFAITGIGLMNIRFLSMRRRIFAPAESLALAPLAGAVPISLATLGLGMAGLARPWAMTGLLLLFCAIAIPGWRYWLREWRTKPKQKIDLLQLFSIILILVIFALAVPYALSPVVQSDALRYHVAAPAQWLRDGHIHYLPNQAFSNFPFLGEMLFMLAMAAGGNSAAQVVHLGMLPVCMGLISLIALRWMRWSGVEKSRGYALAAAAAFAVIPSAAILAGWAFIDLFMAAYFLAFTLAGAASLSRPRRRREIILGVMIAGGLSVKYSMLPLMGVLGVVWFMMRFKAAFRSVGSVGSVGSSSFRSAFLVGLIGLALASPWYIRNAAWTGDPFYPLAIKHFPSADWSIANEQFYMSKTKEKGFKIEALPRPLAAPIELLMTPYTVTYRPNLFEDHIAGPLPLIALIISLGWLLASFISNSAFSTRHSALNPRSFLFVCLSVSWIFWFATYQATRMLFPTFGLLLAWAATAASGWELLGKLAAYAVRTVVGAAMLLSLTIYVMLMVIPNGRGTSYADAVATALGFEPRDAYLARAVSYWHPARWLSRHAGPGEKALLIGEHRSLYFDLPIVVSDWYDTPQPAPWFRRSTDNQAMLDQLLADNVHYIFYNQDELSKYYDSYFTTRLDPAEIKRFEELLPTGDRIGHDPRLREIESRGSARHQMIIYRILPR